MNIFASLITQKVLASIIRHVMTAAGAYLVAGGYLEPGAVEGEAWQAILGGAVAVGGLGWSFAEKVKT